MREIHTVFVHCSASDKAEHDDIAVIRTWHLARNFDDVGYHYFIQGNGKVQTGRSLERIPAAQHGFNTGTIAVCLHGLTTFSEAQFRELRSLIHTLEIYARKKLRVRGHCEVDAHKTCPVFDYRKVLDLDEKGFIKRNALTERAESLFQQAAFAYEKGRYLTWLPWDMLSPYAQEQWMGAVAATLNETKKGATDA